MANILSKGSETNPASDAVAYIVNDPGGTPADKKASLGNIITKAHGLGDGVLKTATGVMSVATEGTDYYKPGGTDVAVTDGGTGASSASGARTNLGLVIGTDVVAPNQDTTGKSAKTDALNSATTVIDVSSATAPSANQVLTATDSTHATWQTPASGFSDPLTTKGDIIGHSTVTTRIPVGTDGQVLTADSSQALGVKYATPSDASTNTSTSVDSEVVLFSGTGGKTLKRATTTGILKGTSGVLSAATAGTDYYNPGGTDVAVADGGTGASTKTAGFDALSPMSASGDIIYGGASGTGTRLAKGSDGDVLKLVSGLPAWGSNTGGQTLFEAIVAASGGDYTTVGAAITAGKKRIFVRSGTYSESSIALTTTTNDDTIIFGEHPETTVLSFTSNTFTSSALRLRLQNIKLSFSTGGASFTGNNTEMIGCHLDKTGATTVGLSISAQSYLVEGCNMSSSTTSALTHFRFQGDFFRVVGNYFTYEPATTNSMIVQSSNSNGGSFTGNTLKTLGTGTSTMLIIIGRYLDIVGNDIQGDSNVGKLVNLQSEWSSVTGNTLKDGKQSLDFSAAVETMVSDNYIRRTFDSTTSTMITFNTSGSSSDNSMTGNIINNQSSSGSNICIDDNSGANGALRVFANNVVSYGQSGTILRVSNRCAITGNRLNGSSAGIGVDLVSNYNVVTGNYIVAATNDVKCSASYQTIVGNTFPSQKTTMINFSTSIGINCYDNFGLPAQSQRQVRLMKNTSGGTLNAGDVVVLKSAAAGNEVTTTTTASDSKVFGMCEESTANNAFGSILVEGHTVLLKVNGTNDIAIGDWLTTYTAAGIAQKATPASLGVTLGDLAFAFALEAYATDDSSGVIDALLVPGRRL